MTASTNITVQVTCPSCGGPVAMDNHVIRRNVDLVGTEGIAVLSCDPCGRRWDLFLHLSPSATKTTPLSGAQQRARRRLRELNGR